MPPPATAALVRMTEFFSALYELLRNTGLLRVSLQDTWMIVLLITAFVWGGGPEKIAIGIWLLMREIARYTAKDASKSIAATQEVWGGLNWNYFLLDCLLLVGFVSLALVANRRYVFWIAGAQVIVVMGHGVRVLSDDLTIFVYVLMVAGAGWMQIFMMTGGQIAHVRRKRGVYADWRWQVARGAPG